MLDACYSPSAVETAVDLANTLRPIKGEDALETVEQLRDFLDDHPPAGPPVSDPDRGAGPRRLTRATPALRHDHDHWWTEVTSDTDRCAAHLAATTLSALARVIATLGPTRLGVCAGPSCRSTFVDLSRNGSKQYCTRTCAHRASVAAYRSRHSRH